MKSVGCVYIVEWETLLSEAKEEEDDGDGFIRTTKVGVGGVYTSTRPSTAISY